VLLLVATATGAAVVAVGVVQVLEPRPLLPTSVDEAAVAVPEHDDPAEPTTLGERDPEQAAQLRAMTDLDRLRCAPEPCEVWRVALSGQQVWDLQVLDGRVAIVDGEDAVVVDVLTGRELLRVTVVGDGAVTGDGDAIEGPQPLRYATALDDGVVAAVGRNLVAFRRDGTVRWSVEEAGQEPGQLRIVAGNPMLMPVDTDTGTTGLVVVDGDTGETLLETSGGPAPWFAPRDDVLFLWDDSGPTPSASAIDPRTGALLWERPLPVTMGYPDELGDLVLLRTEPGTGT
jgi:hypothetical protein